MIRYHCRHSFSFKLVFSPVWPQVLAVVHFLFVVLAQLDSVPKSEYQDWCHDPEASELDRTTPARARFMSRSLAIKTEHLQYADHRKPKADPENSWNEHDKAAWIKLGAVPEMDVATAEAGELLSEGLLTGVCSDSLCLFPGPFKHDYTDNALG